MTWTYEQVLATVSFSVTRLIIQLEEAQKKFDIRWQDHETDFQALIKSRRSEEKYFSVFVIKL